MSAFRMPTSRGVLLALTLGVCGLLTSGPGRALPLGIDGSWFDPDHSGHGVTVERIDAARALLFWHVFDPNGQPLTLYIDALVEGDTLRGQAWAPQGMRFGVFNPQTLQLPEWGEVSLQFSDCGNAVLRWRALLPEYGEGEAALQRLLPLGDPGCHLAAPAGLAGMEGHEVTGSVRGDFTLREQDGVRWSLAVAGHVDAEGVLRATVEPFPAAQLSETPVLIGQPLPSTAGRAELRVRYLRNRLADLLDQVYGQETGSAEGGEFPLQLRTRSQPRDAAAYDYTGRVAGIDGIDLRVLPWSRQRPRSGLYGDLPNGELRIASDGTLCLRITGDPPAGPCRFSGRILGETAASFRFQLQESDSDEPPYLGSGVAAYTDQGGRQTSVTLIGDNGRQGFYYESRRFIPVAD